ncbi:putative alkaline shock family protein YloU [Natranaerovirga pectinivora]|uniref:Putative alkaline shock family protein YloU n=1 Tax=Natranaerovirga pectinivora TaxID=682400 RepID=A0A4R3MQ82_9FIRM|nr:Asp23/Gls24 family envelope stress response protein [Natranaerovirga pectinivora]TCT16954.1 putative alkaline shock family protein YloU [Natranaerovirga pectinivora]
MKGRMATNIGDIIVDNEVISKYAGLAAVECYGIVGMAMITVKEGIVKLLKRESLGKGVKVNVIDNRIEIDFHVIVEYGIKISAVADNLISTVKYKVEKFTGMEVSKINIFVEGVRVD